MDVVKRKNRCRKLIIFVLMALLVFGQYVPAQAANKTGDPITLNRTIYTLKKGKTIKLKATLNKAEGISSGAKKQAVIWKSSNPKVASMSRNGRVTAKKKGKTTITARIKGTRAKASSRIIVGMPVRKIKVRGKSVSLKAGAEFTLKTTVSPKRASVKKLTYESSNPKVATVSQKGVIRAVSAGTAKIWVTAADGSGKKDSCTVTVTENTVPVSGQPEEPENPEQPEEPEGPEQPEQPEQPEEPDDSEKTLVVYFGTPVQERSGQVDGISSASRTSAGETYKGNTEYIAEMISRETGADLFEIVPEIAYADVYEPVRDLAQQEQQQNARPAIKNEIQNFSQYDTVYVGYPIWWSDMPQILYTFFDTYDFSGKNIIPFSTHGGSGLSGTVARIKNLEPQAAVYQGLAIRRTDVLNSESRVKSWIQNREM